MLVAADLLSAQVRRGQVALSHDILFVTLSGDSLDLTGSRRFLFELENGSNSTAGIDLSKVDAVLEVGMTAAPAEGEATRLYVHPANASSSAASTMVQAGTAVNKLTVRALALHAPCCVCRLPVRLASCVCACTRLKGQVKQRNRHAGGGCELECDAAVVTQALESGAAKRRLCLFG